MSVQLISVLVLCGIFVVATALPVHMGALSLGAAFVLGMSVLEGTLKARVDQVAAGFPGGLFVVLAGVTFLFAIARNNGTVDWLVRSAVRAVGGRVPLLPWVFFFVTALVTALGAVVPAAVAMIAPLGMGLAVRYGMNPVLVGLMIANGATAGAFSPIGIFGSITNGVVTRNELPGSPVTLFVASFTFNLVLAAITAVVFGQRAAGNGQRGVVSDAEPDAPMITDAPVTGQQMLTVVSLLGLATGALFFGLDVGFSAFVVVVILSLADPKGTKGAVDQIAWSTVLLVCGIVTYVTLMEKLGTITYLGDAAARIGTPLVAALVICYIGGVVSAFASTTGILGALIPLAVPFLKGPEAVGAVGLIAALAISSSVVDSSPFSTTGSLVVANAPAAERDRVFRRLMQWGFTMVALAPVATWLILVVPGVVVSGGALDGVRVIEVGVYMAAPFAALQLADLGADVIKVESPDGEPVRASRPFVDGESSAFLRLNRNKRSLVLDLKTPAGRQAFLRVAESADVVIENLRPGAMRKLGLAYEDVRAVNPRIVYASGSGWGQDGPLADRPGMDIMAQARGGLMSITGSPDGAPAKVGVPIADLVCALYIALGVTAALRERERSGAGQYLDVSLLESAASLAIWEAARYFVTGDVGARLGTAHQSEAPYQAVRTADGWVTIAGVTPKTWAALCAAIGAESLRDDSRFVTSSSRFERRATLIPLIEEQTVRYTTADLTERLERAGVPCAPIADYGDVFTSAHLAARDYFWDAASQSVGAVRQLGSPMRLSRTPAQRGNAGPSLGADTRIILREAGLSDAEVADLVAAGVAVAQP